LGTQGFPSVDAGEGGTFNLSRNGKLLASSQLIYQEVKEKPNTFGYLTRNSYLIVVTLGSGKVSVYGKYGARDSIFLLDSIVMDTIVVWPTVRSGEKPGLLASTTGDHEQEGQKIRSHQKNHTTEPLNITTPDNDN
jgi:hypothetical protein